MRRNWIAIRTRLTGGSPRCHAVSPHDRAGSSRPVSPEGPGPPPAGRGGAGALLLQAHRPLGRGCEAGPGGGVVTGHRVQVGPDGVQPVIRVEGVTQPGDQVQPAAGPSRIATATA